MAEVVAVVPENDGITAAGATTVYATLVTIDEETTPVVATSPVTTTTTSSSTSTSLLLLPPPPEYYEVVHQAEETYDARYDRRRRLDHDPNRRRCLLHGCICTYVAIDCNCDTIGCRRTSDCCCIRYNVCCALCQTPYPCGISIGNDWNDPQGVLMIECICCECGLVSPTTTRTLCTTTDHAVVSNPSDRFPFIPTMSPTPYWRTTGSPVVPRVTVVSHHHHRVPF